MGVNNIIKVAFIGAGNMASEHVKAFSAFENASLCGIYSRTKSKAQNLSAQYNIKNVYDNIQELYEHERPDLVVITVSVAQMFQVTCEASHYPWAMLLEKPPALNLEQAQELSSILYQKNINAYVALNRRYLSSTISAIENLETISGARSVRVYDQQPIKNIRALDVHPDEVIKNWMYANSIHLIDYFSHFCRGNISKVIPLVPWHGEDTEYMSCFIAYDSGDTGIYECRFKGPGSWAVSISTKNILWELKPLEKANYVLAEDRTVHHTDISENDQKFKAGFYLQAENVLKAISGHDSNAVTLSECLKTMALIKRIY